MTIFIALLSILLIPSAYYTLFNAGSLAPGLIIASLIVFALSLHDVNLRKIRRSDAIKLITAGLAICTISTLTYIYNQNNKTLTALALLPIAVSGYAFSKKLQKASASVINDAILYSSLIIIILGWLAILKITIAGGYTVRLKPVPPFAEQSHYALALGVLLTAYSFSGSRSTALILLVNGSALAFAFPNLTLLIFSALSALALILRTFQRRIFPVLALSMGIAFTALYTIQSIEYFSDRINFKESDNLTTLVWIQGWELAYKNLAYTYGVGVGIQSLGLQTTHLTDVSDRIARIAGTHANIQDGGFLAAKLISELGLIGLTCTLLYLIYLKNTAIEFIRTRYSRAPHDDALTKKMALNGIIFSLMVEFFFRGYGYFSPGLFLAFAAWMTRFSPSRYTPHTLTPDKALIPANDGKKIRKTLQ